MKPIKYLFTLLVLSILTACASPTYEKLEVKDKEVVKVQVPTYLTQPCLPTSRPPSTQEYLSLSPIERERAQTDYSLHLTEVISKCNIKLNEIKKLNLDKK